VTRCTTTGDGTVHDTFFEALAVNPGAGDG
jgi:hypothetical protein